MEAPLERVPHSVAEALPVENPEVLAVSHLVGVKGLEGVVVLFGDVEAEAEVQWVEEVERLPLPLKLESKLCDETGVSEDKNVALALKDWLVEALRDKVRDTVADGDAVEAKETEADTLGKSEAVGAEEAEADSVGKNDAVGAEEAEAHREEINVPVLSSDALTEAEKEAEVEVERVCVKLVL